MALVASWTIASLSYPVRYKIGFPKRTWLSTPPKERERHGHANQRAAFRLLLVRSICQLPAEKPRVRDKAIM